MRMLARAASGLLDAAPPPILAGVGRTLARTRPLELYPGWTFAIEEERSTWDVGFRLALWRAFRDRGIQRPVRVRWYDGLVVDLILGNDQSRCLYVGGSFEPNEFWFLGTLLRPGMFFVDVGANEGFYTLFAARRVAPGGRVYAFEPSPREGARLENNIFINRLINVRVFKEGLAEQSGAAVLHVADPEHNGQNTLGTFGHPGVRCEDNIEIALTTLDSLREKGEIVRIDVVKMDVEGAELRVLEGAVQVLQLDKPVLIMELFDAALRGQNSSAEQVLDFLRNLGFRIFEFDPASGKATPVLSAAPRSSNIIACHPEGRFVL
jgi:FkbM family methyltransferase